MLKSHLRNTILALLFCMVSYQSAFATHIIGGEMNYKCLGNNQYEVSLTVYRDCFLGEAPLDDTAYVAVYTSAGALFRTLPILLGGTDTISQLDACLIIPPNICVETTTYVDTIQLLPRPGGYHLSYQRCCRNATILNIIDPLNTGATYDIVLSETSMLVCNSSPVISDWPPTFICVNRPINYNHAATDIDGDSLVYSLCTPFQGGISLDNPRPRPAFPPPYDTVIWKTPYNLQNVLGGTPLKINRQNGNLTGTPNVIGQYVVGICIQEYRNGQLLSTTRRDFQYNVIPCEDVIAQFDIPEAQCDDFTIELDNQTGGEPEGYLWEFLDTDLNVIDTSTQQNPLYTFPDTGLYTIRLAVNPNGVCNNFLEKDIYIQNNSVVADFRYDLLGCADSLVLQFNDLSIDSIGTITNWNWIFNGEIDQFTSFEQNPMVTIKTSQLLNVTLEVTSENGCVDEHTIEMNAMIIPDSFSISSFDTLRVCQGDSIELNPIFNQDLIYIWSPPDGLSDIHSPNPRAFPDVSTDYLLMIRDSSENCELRKSVYLEVINFDTSFNFSTNILECQDSIQLQINVDAEFDLGDRQIQWEVINAGNTTYYSNLNPILVIDNSEIVQIIGRVFDGFGCSTTKTQSFQLDLISEEINEQLSVCRGDSIELNPEFNPNYTYQWLPANLFKDPSSPNPKISPLTSQVFTVIIGNETGNCSIQKNVEVSVLETIESADFQFRINGCTDSLVLEIFNIATQPFGNINNVLWELEGDQTTITSEELLPTFILKNSQFVTLKLNVNPKGSCPFVTSKSFRVNLLENFNLADSIVICNGEQISLNPNAAHPEYIYQWTPANSLSDANAINPIASPNQTTNYQLSYTDSTRLCQIDKTIKIIVLDTLEKLAADFQVNCDGKTVNFLANNSADINWDFGDNTSIVPSNGVAAIQHIYETPGAFEVHLKYSSSNICPDSTSLSINIPEDNLSPKFEWNVEACDNNVAALELIDLSKSIFGEITNWDWALSNGMTATEQEPLFSISENGPLTATLIVTLDNDASCKDSFTLEIPELLINEPIPDSLFACFGNIVSLNPEFDDQYIYDWMPTLGLSDPSAPNPIIRIEGSEQYIVQISNEFECKIIDTIKTDVAPEIKITGLEIPPVCEEMEVVLLAESDQAINQWWLNENGDTLSFEPELLVNIKEPTTYSAGFVDEFGCVNQEDLFIDYQPIVLEYAAEQRFCPTDDHRIIIENLRPENELKFDWEPNADVISGGTTSNPIVQAEEPTIFTFTAGNEFDCQVTGQVLVEIKTPPAINVDALPDTVFAGSPVQLVATENLDYVYNWSPNNTLNNSSIFNPIALPKETTTYTVSVADELGCTNTASVEVFVRPAVCGPPYIFVPTGFTPNGDGENDILYVRGNFISDMTFIIFDRWGDKVFETSNKAIGWDGTRNGKELPSGVFGYYLRAVCENGEVYTKQGNITLIR